MASGSYPAKSERLSDVAEMLGHIAAGGPSFNRMALSAASQVEMTCLGLPAGSEVKELAAGVVESLRRFAATADQVDGDRAKDGLVRLIGLLAKLEELQ